MADGYIAPIMVTDAEDLSARIYDYINAVFPGWTPADGNFETIISEAFASVAADTQDLAAQVPPEVFRTFGVEVVGLDAVDALPATVTSTWVAIDNAGHTVPEGTAVSVQGPTGAVTFVVSDDVLIAPGSTSTGAGEVTLIAVEPTAAGNGVSGSADPISTLTFVDSITLVGVSSGGQDAETTAAYLNRLSDELRLLTPRPILPNDFAVLARRVPGVFRATAVDGYDPTVPATGVERMVAIALVGEDGLAVDGGVKTAVEDLLESMREVNFVVNAFDATYTDIVVVTDVVSLPGYDAGEVQARVVAALEAYLSPALWGRPSYGDQDSTPGWINTTVVRLFEVVEIINRVDGVDYIDDLTLNGSSADVTMSGYVALPILNPAPTVAVT